MAKQRTGKKNKNKSKNNMGAIFTRFPEIASQLSDFSNKSIEKLLSMGQLDRNALFEQFVALQILRRWYMPQMTRSNLDLVMTGDADDDQIDALGILVNDRLVNSIREAQEEFESTDNPRVTFLFIQTTATQRFIRTKMNDFIVGVKHLFAEQPYWVVNDAILAKKKVVNFLWEECGKNANATLEFDLFYVALGSFTEDKGKSSKEQPLGWRRYAEHELQDSLGLMAVPMVNIIDAQRLLEIVKTNEIMAHSMKVSLAGIPSYSRVLPLDTLLPLPAIDGIESGYIGYLQVEFFLELLERDDGQGLLDDIGFTNVRAFLGADNKVNQEIEKTLTNADKEKFVLLNNGVTLVAEAGTIIRSRFIGGRRLLKLENYQIVNGLQTSYVIYKNRQKLGEKSGVCVPVKIVVSDNTGLQIMVAQATNQQTAINIGGQNRSALFGFELEKAFATYRENHPDLPVWYERREGEYQAKVPEESLFEREDLLRLMVATFQAMPHRAAQGPAGLNHKVPLEIFNDAHSPQPYLVAALLGHHTRLFLSETSRQDLVRFEFHMVYGLFLLLQEMQLPMEIGSEDCVQSCLVLLEKLKKKEMVLPLLEKVAESMREVMISIAPGSRQMNSLPRSKRNMTVPLMKILLKIPDIQPGEKV